VDRAFKWGLGPYLDGLFAQGSFGIVTQGTIVLAPTPPSTVGFFFSLARDEDLEPAMEALREVLNSVGSLTGAVNLMNARRVLAMAEPYPRQLAAGSGAVPAAILQERAKRYGIFPWTGVGALYGEKSMVEAAKRVVRQRLKGKVKRLFFMTPQLAQRARGVVRWLPAGGGRLARVADKLDKTLSLLAGQPSEIALPLAYLHSGNVSGHGKMNPALDGCGLIWYSPLVPMSADRVRTFVEMTERICVEHGIEPLITLTSISSRCLDSTVPILFDRDDPSAAVRADRCYRALFEAGRGEGFLPYRMGSQYMDLVTSADNSFWRLVAKIKQAVDPQGIMSPGRYCPLRED
jgi:4-cresol dehydrogenase (hydroxylating)